MLNIVPGRLMSEKNSFYQVNQLLRILRKWGREGQGLPVVNITSGKGPVVKELIPLIIWGTSLLKGKGYSSI